jgi:DNA-directed RNA polymerase subunit beta'
MIIGAYYLTMALDGLKGEGRAFTSLAEAIMAHDLGELEIGAKIKLRLKGSRAKAERPGDHQLA